MGASGRIDRDSVPDPSDDSAVKRDGTARVIIGPAGEFRRTMGPPRIRDGAPLERPFPGGPNAGEAFPMFGDEHTLEYNVGQALTLLDTDGEQTWDASASAVGVNESGEVVRVSILPRTPNEVSRRMPSIRAKAAAASRFEAKSQLGTGSLGDISLEFDHDIERSVVVKRLRSNDPDTVIRFADEVRTIGGLEHPNIVPIHDVGVDESDRYYFVMKYVEGETLETVIQRLAAGDADYSRRYPVERRAEICMEVMNALAYAHARGVVHRNIKPSNIRVGKYGEVTLMDWGVAKQSRGPFGIIGGPSPEKRAEPANEEDLIFRTRVGTLVGTPYYMSPEQTKADNDALDERGDVYSFSVVMHELFTLRHYLAGRKTLAEVLDGINGPERPFTSFLQDAYQAMLPSEIMHVVRKGMRKQPAARFQSMTEMADAFRKARSGRFEIQCHFTLMKRGVQGLARFIDNHPFLVTAAFVATVFGLPSLLILAVLRSL